MGACGECARNLPKWKWINISAKHWQLIFTSSIQHKLHIYMKQSTFNCENGWNNPFSRPQYNTSFTYTITIHIHSNKVHIYVTIQYNNHSSWRRKQVRFSTSLSRGEASTYIYIKQSWSNGKYGSNNGRNEVGRRRKTTISTCWRRGESGVEWEVVGGGGMDKGQPRLVVAHFVSIVVAHFCNAPRLRT